MTTADVFDVPARERITDVRSYSNYMSGWRSALTPEQVEAQNRFYREEQRRILLWRIKNKERNMINRLERRRAAIRGKWVERGKAALVVLGLLVAAPIVGMAVSLAWNAFWGVVL